MIIEAKLGRPCSIVQFMEKTPVGVNEIQGNHLEDPFGSKALPTFDLYISEEKEGSGGYGTVYRARRKSDGLKFAIKYPHPNANKRYVDIEREMLERFGGKQLVIKYEGSCRSETSDCIVLKHVEHDRPAVLMKEIDIFEIQWYGYCMFTALASLHKLGVVHRDVKPGNILFSRKNCVGYLIDFNHAKDLDEKQPSRGKLVKLQPKTLSLSKKRTRGFRDIESNMVRKKRLSAKGSTLKRKLREPLPCHGRRELINLAHEAIEASRPKRKVIPATLTGKRPCCGTKGFRAPEVLLGLIQQGPKLDVWSAGVTLLALIIGKPPFTGEPEENMKQIVKLRGSKQVMALAKLHDYFKSSIQTEHKEDAVVQSMELKEWCKANTKRPDLVDAIPGSLFDLVDKCLIVNPRIRISAEEALRHHCFATCIAAVEKVRLISQQMI